MRRILTLAVFGLMLESLPACKSQDAAAAVVEESIGKQAFVEDQAGGSVAWKVDADGQLKALVTTPDGKARTDGVTGSLVWKDAAGPQTIPLAPDPKTGVLLAQGPKLSADLTEIDYTLSVGGKPWTGALHLPPGGTDQLAEGAKIATDITLAGNVGPHGGSIEVVGHDRVEVVQNQKTREVRLYVLDGDLKPVAVGDRTITIAVVADKPEVLVLTPSADGAYVSGRLRVSEDPVKLTIAVRVGGEESVTLVGWRPGVHVVVTSDAPRVKIRVKAEGWGPDDDVDVKVHGRGDVKVRVDADEDIKIKHHEKGGAGVDVKIKVR